MMFVVGLVTVVPAVLIFVHAIGAKVPAGIAGYTVVVPVFAFTTETSPALATYKPFVRTNTVSSVATTESSADDVGSPR